MDISPIESEVRMDRLKNLENEYERWEHIYKYGSSDPFYADGVNWNLVRNHIIYEKQMIEEETPLFMFDEICQRELPPIVPSDYIARKDEIRKNAAIAMGIIDADENLIFIRQRAESLSDKQMKRLCVPAVIGYAENLRSAIKNDDLITMRRYEHYQHYLDSFSDLVRRLNSESELAQTDELDIEEDDELEDELSI